MTGKRQYSTSDERWDDRVEVIAKQGWSLDDLRLRASLTPWDRRRFEQAIIDHQDGVLPAIPKGSSGISTPDAAREAYARLKSERKAADELGMSKTQLRRYLGKDS